MRRFARVACLLLALGPAAAVTLEVAPDGPLRSLSAARDRVRELKTGGLAEPVTVVVRAGTYDLRETLTFDARDGGSAACPVSWRAAPGERVVLRGGRAVTGWRDRGDGVLVADLAANGLAGARFWQLFRDGRRAVLARYPNVGLEHPRTGGFVYVKRTAGESRRALCYDPATLPVERWQHLDQAEVVSVYNLGWNFALTPLERVEPGTRRLWFRPVRGTFLRGNRFYLQNSLDFLDAPDEWFCDRRDDRLYYRPPGAAPTEVLVPVLDHLIEVRGRIAYPHGYLNVAYKASREDFPAQASEPDQPVEHLHFEGFRLEVARQDAIRLAGARHCSVTRCTVTNVGGVGINLGAVASAHEEVGNPRVTPAQGASGGVGGGGQNLLFQDPCGDCRVAGNDVWATGSDGIFLYGTGNLAENNHVYDIGLYDKDCAAINLFGERNIARRNTLHHLPRNAIFLKGIDQVVELNDIHDTCLETCDGGAIRMCQRNLTLRGNAIRHNRIVDTVGYGYPRGADQFRSPYFTWGVYLDDYTCGTTVEGNLIVRCGRGGIHVHGGGDNLIKDNLVLDAVEYQFENNAIRDEDSRGNRVTGNVFVYPGEPALLYHCGRWVDGSVRWADNVAWTRSGQPPVSLFGRETIDWTGWQSRPMVRGERLVEPLVGPDGAVAADSPVAALPAGRLPLDRVGVWPDPDRARWPAECEGPLRAEQPVLYRSKPEPLDEDFEADAAGRPPTVGDSLAGPKAGVLVTAELAHGGRQCLKLVDAPDLKFAWLPRIFWAMDHAGGRVTFTCALRISGREPPELGIDLRQYAGAAPKEFLSPAQLRLGPDGRLRAQDTVLTQVPPDTWCELAIELALGEAAAATYHLTVTVAGRPAENFDLPKPDPAATRLDRIVVMSLTNGRSVAWLDDVRVAAIP